MKVAVLGAGVVGTSTAYFLAEDGHDVVVLDRQKNPGQETSVANGGQISACHAKPWAGPNIPLQAFLWTFQADAPLLFRPWRFDPELWSWGLKFLRNCTSARERINMDRTLRVALYSRSVLKALRQKTNIHYDQQINGMTQGRIGANARITVRTTALQSHDNVFDAAGFAFDCISLRQKTFNNVDTTRH